MKKRVPIASLAAVLLTALVAGCAPSAGPGDAGAATHAQPALEPSAAHIDQVQQRLSWIRAHRSASHWYQAQPVAGHPELLRLNDGTVVMAPPNDTPDTSCDRFTGDIPPPCTSTGAFRRVYTKPGQSYMQQSYLLPKELKGMPSGIGPTGFLYLEGWPLSNLNGANSEAGFQFSPANQWLTPYQKAPDPQTGKVTVWYSTQHYALSAKFGLDAFLIARGTCSEGNVQTTCAEASFIGGCWHSSKMCSDDNTLPDRGWTSSRCCVLASMMSIAESTNSFSNGLVFGPANQELCSAPSEATICSQNDGVIGTGQRWPNDVTRVIVQPMGARGVEADTINLHK